MLEIDKYVKFLEKSLVQKIFTDYDSSKIAEVIALIKGDIDTNKPITGAVVSEFVSEEVDLLTVRDALSAARHFLKLDLGVNVDDSRMDISCSSITVRDQTVIVKYIVTGVDTVPEDALTLLSARVSMELTKITHTRIIAMFEVRPSQMNNVDKNLVAIDKGVLQLALNVLERAGKLEVAQELRKSCVDIGEVCKKNPDQSKKD